MVKADDKVVYDDNSEPAKFTYFEELQKRVEVLKETVDELAEILRQNNLMKEVKEYAPYFDEDEVYKRLEDD